MVIEAKDVEKGGYSMKNPGVDEVNSVIEFLRERAKSVATMICDDAFALFPDRMKEKNIEVITNACCVKYIMDGYVKIDRNSKWLFDLIYVSDVRSFRKLEEIMITHDLRIRIAYINKKECIWL